MICMMFMYTSIKEHFWSTYFEFEWLVAINDLGSKQIHDNPNL